MDRQVATENKNKSDNRDERWLAYRKGYHFFKESCQVKDANKFDLPDDELDRMTRSEVTEWLRGWKTACRTFFNLDDWEH